MNDIRLDWDRARRTGLGEAVYCAGKTPDQIDRIIEEAGERRLFFTRLDAEKMRALSAGGRLDFDPLSETAVLGGPVGLARKGVAIVGAGTSDAPVAAEAQATLAFHGVAADLHLDVGVAGLWRLTEKAEILAQARIIIAVAGFEAALFSVLAGLVPTLVIAVPTSVGFGVAAGGRAALSSALASCAPGVVAVNIDNGFGAACAALKILGADEPGRGGEDAANNDSDPAAGGA